MNRIVLTDSFQAAASKFGSADRARIFDFVQKISLDPTTLGLHVEKLSGLRDDSLRSARVSQGIRAILRFVDETPILLYVDDHDPAYAWARRRRVQRHPVTGALQIVTIPEVVEIPTSANSTPSEAATKRLFADHSDEYLVSLGVPMDWIPLLRQIRSKDQVIKLIGQLPEDVAERLLDLAEGELVAPPKRLDADPITGNLEQLRVFHAVRSREDLERLLAQPLEAWVRYLHPSQRRIVDTDFKGPVKVTGAAGTGKTTVALHRAARLARSGKRVLLTSFGTTLCENLRRSLAVLDSTLTERVEVATVHKVAYDLTRKLGARHQAAQDDLLRASVEASAERAGRGAERAFLVEEFNEVVKRQALTTWDEYRAAPRAGRGRPLSAKDRREAWAIFESVLSDLAGSGKTTFTHLCRMAREGLASGKIAPAFDAVVVDEVQDLGHEELRLLAVLPKEQSALTLVGDAGQSIYLPQRTSLKKLGIDVRGRSFTLRINYRTTEEIRRAADVMLGAQVDDLDEGMEDRRRVHSVMTGPDPTFHGFEKRAEEIDGVVEILRELMKDHRPDEIGVFTRINKDAEALSNAIVQNGMPVCSIASGDRGGAAAPGIQIGTMHRAKGLEFKAVVVAHVSSDTVPHASAKKHEDPAAREDAIDQERRLLYVAMTRARDRLFVTWSGSPSPFLRIERVVSG